jgi:predicted metal-dependent hydrolase
MAYEPLYLAYLVYFNRDRDYFECHEVLEKLWLARERDPLYKALLQVAVGLYHFRGNNVRGGTIMLDRASAVLQKYPAETLGIDLAKLVEEVKEYVWRLEAYEAQPFPYYDLTIDIMDQSLAEEVRTAAFAITPNNPQRRGPQRPASSHHK